MKLHQLVAALQKAPDTFPRFVLPDGDYVPAHAHVTEVGHVVKKFIDCGGKTGRKEKVLLQAHVGDDAEHRLRSDRFAKILELGQHVLPNDQVDVEVEYDCCVVAQYRSQKYDSKVSILISFCVAAVRNVGPANAGTRRAMNRPQLVANGR